MLLPPLVLTAPAKLNLFLHVTGRRADGYHLLESVFVPVSLADTVELTATGPDEAAEITLLDAPPGLTVENELGCRAARALSNHAAARAGIRVGARIRIVKRIPSGAGLGGGSSDAAAVLIGLNRLWGLGLSSRELAALALPLGADIPFFLGDGPAFVAGIGEALRPVTVPARDVVIAHPGVAAATKAVFASRRVVRDSPAVERFGWPLDWGGNDLEAAAREIVPEIAALARAFEAGGLSPRMSGSGSALFAFCANAAAARAAAGQLRALGWPAWAARTLGRLPHATG